MSRDSSRYDGRPHRGHDFSGSLTNRHKIGGALRSTEECSRPIAVVATPILDERYPNRPLEDNASNTEMTCRSSKVRLRFLEAGFINIARQ